MKKEEYLEILENTGLSTNEARIYLASTQLGPSTVLNIAKESGIKRTTVYAVVEKMQEKNLMKVEEKGLKKYYSAKKPDNLLFLLDEKKNQFRSVLPSFNALYNLKGGESLIKYYDGAEAIKELYMTSLENIKLGGEYLSITDREKWLGLDEKFFMEFLYRRKKLSIKTRLLLQDSEIARKFKKEEKKFNVQIEFLPKNVGLSVNLIVLPDKVIIHQLTPPNMAILIENPSIVQMHRELFEMIWKSSHYFSTK